LTNNLSKLKFAQKIKLKNEEYIKRRLLECYL
jgi:hypothetical protein